MLNFDFIGFVLIIIIGILATIFDCRTMKIPNAISFPFMGFGLIWNVLFNREDWWVNLIAFVIIFLFGSLRLMGLGDIKMLMAMSLISGWFCIILTVLFSCVLFVSVQLIFHFKETWFTINSTLYYAKTNSFKAIKESTIGSKKKSFFIYILFGYIISFVTIAFNII